ncbi:mycothione reductase [Dermabacter sp. HSID17554]|uniref:mycothione reductase n=1 Tax=Dermabacter sp. HSID17554 TaxID=2419511 RepID=UPI000F85B9BD|nr:mycothione reductase [Dermabacter sp. HSID17554]RUP86772.1 mycothione reductase [Dermabacter sp. HSID17554]
MIAPEHFDIALIGSGSGNSFPGPEFAEKSIVYIDRGVGPENIFGGTCLNLGCIPTKMFVHTANIAQNARREHAEKFGVDAELGGVGFPAVRERIFSRIDPISHGGEEYRAAHPDNANVTLLRGTARFVAPKRLAVETDNGTREITADTFLLAAGSRPAIPAIPGLHEATPLTSDTLMRLEELPESIAILGSGVIALEFAHILDAFGVDVHLIARSGTLLRAFDEDIARRITEIASARYTVHLTTATTEVRRTEEGVEIDLQPSDPADEAARTLTVADILVATGRTPNSDLLDAPAGGIGVDDAGRVMVDACQRALDPRGQVLDGIYSIGDLSSPAQLKHVANHELKVARHNILNPHDLRRSDDMPIPAAVFTSPQIATVGMSEREAREWAATTGREIQVARQEFADVAYGWAMELEAPGDFVKIIAEAETGRILGAHIIGPEAATLIQVLIQAMSFGLDARDIATKQYWIHPAMPEVIENALLQLA